jgi:N-acyl-D-amino-acid deacylase
MSHMIRSMKFTSAVIALLSATSFWASHGAAEAAGRGRSRPEWRYDLYGRRSTVSRRCRHSRRPDHLCRAEGTRRRARKTIDATGLIVAPGFIDPHAHVNEALASKDPATRLVLPFLTQGVTTAFIGVDGYGDPDVARSFGIADTRAGGDGVAGLEQSVA